MSVCRLPVLLTVAALLVHPAWQQQINSTQTPTLTCDAAIDAAFFAARALAAARNVSGIGLTAQSLGRNITSPSAQFVTVLQRSLQQFLDLTANRSTNTVNFFSTSPYSGWGSRMAQTAVGMSTHVPAATLGEIAYIANTLQRNLSNTPAYDPTQVSSSWFRAWDAFAASLRKQASNSTDLYSQRSMLLRAVVYAATGLMPMLPTDAYQQEREQVAQVGMMMGVGCLQQTHCIIPTQTFPHTNIPSHKHSLAQTFPLTNIPSHKRSLTKNTLTGF